MTQLSMTLRNQTLFWAAALAVFIGLIVLFKPILTPFILGLAIAYLLNPVIEKMDSSSHRVSRGAAAGIILAVFFLCVAIILAVLIPILVREAGNFLEELPQLIEKASELLNPVVQKAQFYFGEDFGADWKSLLKDNAAQAGGVAGSVAGGVLAGGLALIDFLTLVIITPIMAFFMMKEWPHITYAVKDLMPRDNEKTIRGLLKEIDIKISAFVRGQLTVVFILAVAYAVALAIAGLKYGVLIGITAGLLGIIPMVGSIIGLFVSVGVALIQTGGDIIYAAIIAAIFLAGQAIEGYVLTPKLVGDSVGLHPLWVIFALMAGGSLLGILGMLIAVPVAAVASVLIAFGMTQYKKSAYYKKSQKRAAPKKKSIKRKTSNAK